MINGVINVYKEAGFTSFDVVAKLRSILKQKKIGHTGTLDPDATGVLPVCLGNATKLCDMLTDKNKTYEAVMLLGKQTDTGDVSGNTISKADVSLSKAQIREAIMSFVGDYEQIPPMYSALKVNGKKLYQLARQGITVERKARPVKILDIEISKIDLENNRVTFRVTCSKGTYIRTLCEDIGEKLFCPACMESLKRTRVSCFDIADAITLSEIEALVKDEGLACKIVSVENIFPEYEKIFTTKETDCYLYNGNKLNESNFAHKFKEGEKVRVYDSTGKFLAIYEYISDEKVIKPVKMFLQ